MYGIVFFLTKWQPETMSLKEICDFVSKWLLGGVAEDLVNPFVDFFDKWLLGGFLCSS